MKGRIAWVAVPHLSGFNTVRELLSEGLCAQGWDVLTVGLGREMADAEELAISSSDSRYDFLTCKESDDNSYEGLLAEWVEDHRIDILIISGDRISLGATRRVSSRVRVVFRCSSMSSHIYSLIAIAVPGIDLVLLETQRQFDDLTKRWNVPHEKCALMPAGVETDVFFPKTAPEFVSPLRLVYVGRIEESAKHVMLLPRIAARLTAAGIPFSLDIAGEGPDRGRLENDVHQRSLQGQVRFLGRLTRSEVSQLLRDAHVMIVPSRSEARCWALLEAMASGCVPVVSHIFGATDMVVEDGLNGFLCRVGDATAFAKRNSGSCPRAGPAGKHVPGSPEDNRRALYG